MCRASRPRREFGDADEIEELEDEYMEESAEEEMSVEEILSNLLHYDWAEKIDAVEEAWTDMKEATGFMMCLRDLSPSDYAYLLSQPEIPVEGDYLFFVCSP